MSEDEDKVIASLTTRLQDVSAEYLRLLADKAPTDETKARMEKLLQEYGLLYKKIEDLNTSYQSVYAYTADTYTQNKTLSWLLLFLTYVKVGDGKPEPLFTGSDFTAKETHAEDMDDSGAPLWKAVMADDKLTTFWQLYLFNRASKTEDFAKYEEEWKRLAAARAKISDEVKKAESGTVASKPADDVPVMISTASVLPRAVAEVGSGLESLKAINDSVTIAAGAAGADVAALAS